MVGRHPIKLKQAKMPKKPASSNKVRVPRRRASEKMVSTDIHKAHQPMMAELYSRAEAHLRNQRKGQRSKAGDQKSPSENARMYHELEVHQIELEMQNAELKQTRNELEVMLAKSTDLYDFAPVGYVSIDDSGVILEANLTSAAMLDKERSQLVKRSLLGFVSPPSRPVFLAFLKQVFSGHRNQTCEALFVKQGGGTFWGSLRATPAIHSQGGRKWCRVVIGDITGRKEAEEALRESEKRYRSLFDVVPVAVYSCNTSGVIQTFNGHAADLWGRAPAAGDTGERFCGSFKLFRPDGSFIPREQCPMAGVVSGKIPAVHDAEVLIERPDGSRITVIVNIRPLRNERGKITGAINCFYDITERRQAEETQRRLEVLAASNRKLEQEIARRQAVEHSLKQTQGQQSRLLEQSCQMQEHLRHLSHQLLSAQEDERKRISRELHDVIAQTLTSINLRLTTLKNEARLSNKGLERSIACTQELVGHSLDIVNRFVRELRPTALDDLGLIPALQTFMKNFTEQTGIRVSFSVVPEVEQLNENKRTVLYRVAQEALTNVARHAKASRAEVRIQKRDESICLEVIDNGKGLPADRVLQARKNQRFGLLGMKERVQMVNGNFIVQSTPGKRTSIRVQIPLAENGGKGFVPAAPKRDGPDHPAPEGPAPISVRGQMARTSATPCLSA